MPFCPKCRTEFREGFAICGDCGEKLVSELPAKNNSDTGKREIVLETEEIYLCPHCGFPVPVREEHCPNCQAGTGPYDTLDPIKRIHEQGRVYRKIAAGETPKRRHAPYFNIIFSLLVFVFPGIITLVIGINLFFEQRGSSAQAADSIGLNGISFVIVLLSFLLIIIGLKMVISSIKGGGKWEKN